MRNLIKNLNFRLTKSLSQGGALKVQAAMPSIIMERRNSIWNILYYYWKLRYSHAHFRLMDINCLTYLGLIGILLIFFHNSVNHWSLLILIHTVFVIGILEVVRLGKKYPHNKILGIFRTFYPVVVFLYAWEELDILVPMFSGTFWATDMIVRWDKLLFGVHPTIWFQQFYQPWLNELMNFFYASYYTFFILVPLSLYISKRKQAAFAVLSVATFVYFSNFCIFYLLPALAPPYIPMLQALQTKQQTGYLFVEINQIVQAQGGIRTGAFPSSHVAGALTWTLCALRYNRKLGYVLAPIAFGIAFSTVYMGLHHGVDPVFGYIWGGICFTIALKLIKKRGEDPLALSKNLAAEGKSFEKKFELGELNISLSKDFAHRSSSIRENSARQ